jgi:hypothetical protein
MLIPAFVTARKRKKSERASAVLRYVLANLAAKYTGRQSMRALAEVVGVDHSTLSTYIRRGSLSVATATRITVKFPDCGVSIAQLVDPELFKLG